MVLDMGTLYAVAAIASAVAGVLHLIPWLTGRLAPWAAWWGFGHIAVGCSSLMVAIFDVRSIAMPVFIPNILSIIGYAMVLQGVRVFERPQARAAPLMILVAIAAVPLFLSRDPQAFVGRIAYLCAVRACCDLAVAYMAVRMAQRQGLQNSWLMAFLFGATVPLFVGRAWLAATGRIGPTLLGPADDLASWLAASAIAFIVFRGFSLLLLDAERSHRSLADLACHDALTGALNRMGLAQLRRRLDGQVAVMMIDVDRFKALNDVEGHAVGDTALRLLAETGQLVLGSRGSLVRTGGDEFLGVMPRLSHEEARALADAIELRFDQEIGRCTKLSPRPTLSIGLAEGAIADGFERLIAQADQSMYAVKRMRQGNRRAA